MAKAKPVVPAELDAMFGQTRSGVATRIAPVEGADKANYDLDTALTGSLEFEDTLAPAVSKAEGQNTKVQLDVQPERTVDAIYTSLNAVHRELARIGMAKDSRNTAQGFNFRGIDGLYNLVSALLAKNNILTLPSMNEHSITSFPSKSGGTMFRATLTAEYRFVSTIDASYESVTVIGEGMDSGDKATNKAMSIAHKYALIQAFNIPVVGSDDPDLESPELAETSVRTAPRRVVEEEPTAPDSSEAPFDLAGDAILVHIVSLTNNEERRALLTTKVLEAYGVMTLDQIPEDRVEEAKANLTSYVEAQKKKAAKK